MQTARSCSGAGSWLHQGDLGRRAGEVFTVVVLFAGLGILLFGLTDLARWVIEGEMRDAFGRRRRTRMLEKLSGHEIVCGWGRMGQAVVEELVREGRPFAVIERGPEKVARLHERRVPVVDGDAVSEEVLKLAGVARMVGAAGFDDAEFAILVADPWQGLGLGRLLTERCLDVARLMQMRRLTAEMDAENSRVVDLLRSVGFQFRGMKQGGRLSAELAPT